jgi:2-oxoglutarate dehydrogenase E2 component (dihydrolipoamide succinyltransferase)
VLARIERKEGEDVKIGEVLGLIEDAQEPRESRVGSSESKTHPPVVPRAIFPASDSGLRTSDSELQARTPSPESRTAGVPATPSARRLAREHDLDLAKVAGDNGGARLTKDVVESHLKSATPAAPSVVGTVREPPSVEVARSHPATAAGPVPSGQVLPRPRRDGAVGTTGLRGEERVRMSRRRQTIARRLVEAQHAAAMLTTFNEVDMAAVTELRKRHRESFKEKYGIGLGIVSFFVKASIAALRSFPRLNAEIQGDEMVLKHYYDIGIAVGASEGLVVPVLRDADRMSFAHIESAIKEFVRKAEDGTLTLDDLRGGTFTISNGGVFGSLLSTPILNPPQVGILGLHKIMERPVTLNGALVSRPMMYVALSYDHRIVDGREAVQFLVKIKQLVEDPGSLLLEV